MKLGNVHWIEKIYVDEQLNLIKFTGLNKLNDMKLVPNIVVCSIKIAISSTFDIL